MRPTEWHERAKFVTRINTTVFSQIFSSAAFPDNYDRLFTDVCYELGVEPVEITRDNTPLYSDFVTPSFKVLTNNDFTETLKVLVFLWKSLRTSRLRHTLDRGVELALATAAADIGVRWRDGMFYPAGAQELDEILIGDNLEWLQAFPKVRASFETALAHFSTSLNDASARKDAITNAYAAIEGLSRLSWVILKTSIAIRMTLLSF